MNYGSLISEAFWLTLRNRFLWFFGLFAGGGASFNFNFNVPRTPVSPGRPGEPPPVWLRDLGQWITDNPGLILAIAALALLVVLVVIFLSILSRGALVESVVALRRGEARRFSSAWRVGLSHFWRVLGLTILFLLIALGLLLVIFVPAALVAFLTFMVTESLGARILVIVLLVLAVITLLLLLFIPLTIINQLALRELVIRRERIVGSIGGAFRLFRQNLGRSLLVWLIQAALLFAAGLVVFLVLLILGVALFAPVPALFFTDLTTGAIVVGVVAALILLVPSLVAGGLLGTFGSSYWTLAYLQLTAPAEEATS